MIDQGHDIPLSEVLFYQMEQVMRQATLATKQAFRENDIPLTKDQWLLLKQLNENAELSQRELAEKTFKEPAAITRMLDLMEKHGWVKREASPGDRRRFTLQVTEQGKELYGRAFPVVKGLRLRALEGVSQTDVDAMKLVLQKMYGLLK
ncbi:MAG: MarR family transcriptional regulator [Bacteroidota bacterium]